MHSTQAVRVILAADETFSASVVAIVAEPVEDGTNPAWTVLLEREGSGMYRWSTHRAIGEVFFDLGTYDLSARRGWDVIGERIEYNMRYTLGRDSLSWDHGEAGEAARLP
jgi:hypothetical protein